MTKLHRFLKNESGVTAEYDLIAAGIGVAIVAIVFTVGSDLKDVFESVSSELQSAG
jgi:pilus assembly protein Flp/PilA